MPRRQIFFRHLPKFLHRSLDYYLYITVLTPFCIQILKRYLKKVFHTFFCVIFVQQLLGYLVISRSNFEKHLLLFRGQVCNKTAQNIHVFAGS